MAKKEKNPVDGYTREAYQRGLDEISNNEANILSHPLHEDVIAYEALNKEMEGGFNPLVETEQKTLDQFEEGTKEAREAIERIRQDLRRQLGNAHREAIVENKERKGVEIAAELLPKIEEMKREAEEIIDKTGETSPTAHHLSRAIIEESNNVEDKMRNTERSQIGAMLIDAFALITELSAGLKRYINSRLHQDRFGKDKE